MQILFVHGNYPAQFHWLAELLGRQGKHDVRFLTAREDAESLPIPGVRVELFEEKPLSQRSANTSTLTQSIESAISLGSTIEGRLSELADSGFVPKLIIFHGGRGLGLLIRERLPDASVIGYFEWFFHPDHAANLLGRQDQLTRQHLELRNLATCQEIVSCDAAVVPTAWQASQFPELLRKKIKVIFDGIDPQIHHPPKSPSRNWPIRFKGESGSLELSGGDILITYATRGMEPLRGFNEFMSALPGVLGNTPNAKVLIAGRDRSAYGPAAPSHNGSWKKRILDKLGDFPGLERIAFTGLLPRDQYIKMLQRTNLHCYFTRPYVPSWSFFEAIACDAPMLASEGGATTQTLPGLIAHSISLDSSSATLTEAMLETLRVSRSAESSKQNDMCTRLPSWMWRKHSTEAWQLLINSTLINQSAQARTKAMKSLQ